MQRNHLSLVCVIELELIEEKGQLLRYVIGRLFTAIPTLFLIVTISFFLIRFAPGGSFDLDRPFEAKVMENLNKIYQLDKPLWEQYLLNLQNVV